MRGKVTDQDLTNYALNELSPEERLYVESMLAVSEECRHDIYQMLEVGEMLKEGFEQDEFGADILLNDEQRVKVLEVPRFHWSGFFQRAAAIALLAAGTAYTMTRPGVWPARGAADQIATAGEAMGNLVANMQNKGFAQTAEEVTARLLKASVPAESSEFQFVAAPAVCTPPIFDMPDMPEVVEM
jgi:anti-sigma factor RsiW